jgi:hypothetical protein
VTLVLLACPRHRAKPPHDEALQDVIYANRPRSGGDGTGVPILFPSTGSLRHWAEAERRAARSLAGGAIAQGMDVDLTSH